MLLTVYIRPLLALLVLAVIVGVAVVVFQDSYNGSGPVLPVNQQLPHNIDVVLKKARFSENKNGLLVWELVAERADYDKSGDTAHLSIIKMEFQRDQSHGAVTVTADSGEYSSLAKTVRLNGNVNVVTEDGANFKTGSIVYTGATSQFSTADKVIFRQQRLQLTAVGMDLGVKSQRAHFYSSVDAAIASQ